ncbi:MAG TPA: hypothetical protein PLB02_05735 [Thermoanaerobaculia bacterium]|nr:hypothetical protein [Thermoanaerobaculia bacterium]HQR66877.1 hypothetical protein [Thermoanaerobaculia bacterium]
MRRLVTALVLLAFSATTLADEPRVARQRPDRRVPVYRMAADDDVLEVQKSFDPCGRAKEIVFSLRLSTGETEEIVVETATHRVRAFDLVFTPVFQAGAATAVAALWVEGAGQRAFVELSGPPDSEGAQLAARLVSSVRLAERTRLFERFRSRMPAGLPFEALRQSLDASGEIGPLEYMSCAPAAIGGILIIAGSWALTGACAVATGGACLGALGVAVGTSIHIANQIADSCG